MVMMLCPGVACDVCNNKEGLQLNPYRAQMARDGLQSENSLNANM